MTNIYHLVDHHGDPLTKIPAHWGLDGLTRGGNVFSAPSHREALRTLNAYLSVGGPRGLSARTDDGAEIHASLYDGEDRIIDAAGRRIV